MELLDKIQSNADLRAVRQEEIPHLCSEIRSFLVDNVSKTGGHLASNLGSVELTVALHRVYDPESDRILFDVGHQAYVHKMLTGRMDRFSTLRQKDGLSGFPKPSESDADPFLAGHASDSVSVALGMARARTLLGKSYDIVAVLGDGAMTGGLAYEGLSDAGASREPIVIILNDNGMSINRNVGGIARLLSRARMRPGYFRFKKAYRRVMTHMPGLYMFFHRIKERLKSRLIPQGIFDDLGFNYLGPVDGHDEAALESAIRWGRELRTPVLIHVVTTKGKGYPPAEKAPELYHGVSAFDPAIGIQAHCEDCYSARFGQSLTALAGEDETVCAVTAAMVQGTGLETFAEKYPKRFFELGIVEGHAAVMCGGMAKQGLKPVFAVYSSFLQRSYDMLIEDVGLLGLHVVFAVDRAGIVGRDGVTHQGSFDLAFLSTVPGMTVYAPSSYAELDSMLRRAVMEDLGPAAIRYPRGGEGRYTDDRSFESTSVLRQGSDATLICHGITVDPALEAAEILSREGVSCCVIKLNRLLPLDADAALDSLRQTGVLASVEDVCHEGCAASRILALCAENGIALSAVRMADLGGGVVPHGSPEQLYESLGMDAQSVAAMIREAVGEKDPA